MSDLWSGVYGYVRVSGVGQLRGSGPGRQREEIERFACVLGMEVVGWYEDAYTGAEDDRPAFVEMLGSILGNGVRVVVVECLDRLARDLMVQSLLLSKLASSGVSLWSATTGEDVTASMLEDPMRRALVQIQGVFSELEKNLVVRRLSRGKALKRKSGGRVDGLPAYGHWTEEELDEMGVEGVERYGGEEAVLERIRRLVTRKPRRVGVGVRRGPGCAKAARVLNADGVPTRSGRPWSRGTVWKIAKREGWI